MSLNCRNMIEPEQQRTMRTHPPVLTRKRFRWDLLSACALLAFAVVFGAQIVSSSTPNFVPIGDDRILNVRSGQMLMWGTKAAAHRASELDGQWFVVASPPG